MSTPNSAKAERENTKKLMGLRSRGGAALMVAITAPLLSGVLLVGYAALLAQVLGRTIEDGERLAAVWPLIAGMAAIVIGRAVIGLIGEQAGQIGAERIKLSLRNDLFAHLVAKRSGLGMSPASGAVGAALIDQINGLENFFARYLPAMVSAAILPVAFAVILFPVDWIVALLFLVTAPLIPFFMALVGWGAQAATRQQATALSRLSAYFADRLRGLLTLKLFGHENQAMQDVHDASENLRRRTNAVLGIAFLSSAILEFFAALGIAGVALYVGLTYLGFLTISPALTLTAGLFALIMAPEVYNPLRQLAAHYHDRAAAKSALAEIEDQVHDLDRLTALPPAPDVPASRAEFSLSIQGLTIRTPHGHAVLDDLELQMSAGQSLAIMGPSGIGKTTLARAIARLIDSGGTIELSGRPLAAWPEHDLRRAITYISQRPHIFAGTIADNIAFARPDVSPWEVQEAAHRARVTDFATLLPAALDTRIGEGGYGLSGGQVQRIGLARLFLTDPDLIILDEPTARLDAATQDEVLDAIWAFARARALIVLTHSTDVANRADQAMRMAGGKLLPMPHRKRTLLPREHRA